jgi:hypothetical protein
MKVNGGFGILHDVDNPNNRGLLPRSLLWRRGKNTSTLQKIDFPIAPEAVPSWSWMAVSGGIDYFPLEFNGFDWQAVESPWSSPAHANKDIIIKGQARSFTLPTADSEDHEFIFDDRKRPKQNQTKVIVLGIEKIPEFVEARYYVLLVDMLGTLTSDGSGHEYCKRVGAGHLPGKWLIDAAIPCALI